MEEWKTPWKKKIRSLYVCSFAFAGWCFLVWYCIMGDPDWRRAICKHALWCNNWYAFKNWSSKFQAKYYKSLSCLQVTTSFCTREVQFCYRTNTLIVSATFFVPTWFCWKCLFLVQLCFTCFYVVSILLALTNNVVVWTLLEGGIVNNTLRPPIPERCDPGWRKLMEECWSFDPEARPSFTEITNRLRLMSAALQPKRRNAIRWNQKISLVSHTCIQKSSVDSWLSKLPCNPLMQRLTPLDWICIEKMTKFTVTFDVNLFVILFITRNCLLKTKLLQSYCIILLCFKPTKMQTRTAWKLYNYIDFIVF